MYQRVTNMLILRGITQNIIEKTCNLLHGTGFKFGSKNQNTCVCVCVHVTSQLNVIAIFKSDFARTLYFVLVTIKLNKFHMHTTNSIRIKYAKKRIVQRVSNQVIFVNVTFINI